MNNPLLLTSALAQMKGSSDWNERTGGTLKANLTPFECRAVLDALATAERERDEARAKADWAEANVDTTATIEISQLRADLAAAREALRDFVNCSYRALVAEVPSSQPHYALIEKHRAAIDAARAKGT